jgi:hypothetical protein
LREGQPKRIWHTLGHLRSPISASR